MFTALVVCALFAACAEGGSFNATVNSTLEIIHVSGETCQPTNWYDVTVFFIGNYFAHAATVKTYPGEGTARSLIATGGALLIPTSGLVRGLNSIFRNAKFKRKGIWAALVRDPDYETATASGSLVMVVRKKSWKPLPGDKVSDVILREESKEIPAKGWALRKRNWGKKSKVRGFYNLEPVLQDDDSLPKNPSRALKVYRGPWALERAKWWTYTDTADEYVSASKTIHGFQDFKGQEWSYALAHVPRDAVIAVREMEADREVSPRSLESAATSLSFRSQSTACERSAALQTLTGVDEGGPSPVISASYSLPKAMIAIVQLGFAIVTLYLSSGNELDYYGYAAFGLTVIPYALMSFVNLLGNMLTPDYHALYLVGSDVMDEAIRRGCRFDGVVGRLVQDTSSSTGSAEVVSPTPESEKCDDKVSLSYNNETEHKEFSATLIDYSTPDIPMAERRKLISKLIESTYRDLSPSIFIPSCSKFLRHRHYDYITNANRTQMTHQGSFSFSPVHFSLWRNVICFLNGAVVIGIIGGLTRFRTGQSSIAQLNWILHWYIFGTVYSGYGLEDFITSQRIPEPDMGPPSQVWGLLVGVPLLLYGIPAFGGFVVVTRMLYQYGTCSFG